MARVYKDLIRKDLMSLEQVPEKIREQVSRLLVSDRTS